MPRCTSSALHYELTTPPTRRILVLDWPSRRGRILVLKAARAGAWRSRERLEGVPLARFPCWHVWILSPRVGRRWVMQLVAPPYDTIVVSASATLANAGIAQSGRSLPSRSACTYATSAPAPAAVLGFTSARAHSAASSALLIFPSAASNRHHASRCLADRLRCRSIAAN